MSGLKRITAGELFDRKFPVRENIIEPWFRTGETALIWAGTGVGKTMLTLSLALAIAGGGKVWQWGARRPRKVLIIDGEMHLQDLHDRLLMLMESGAVSGFDEHAVRSNLSIIARQDQDPESSFYDITNEDSQVEIYKRCRKEDVEVLIVDNLTTVADGLDDENEATAFRSVQGFFLRMKQAGIATILVHHSRKDGQSPRGSTALTATFEVILGLVKPKVAPPGRAAFVARFDKFRAKGDASIKPYCWTLEDHGWQVEEDHEDSLVETLNAFQSLKFATQQEVADALGVSKSAVSKRVKRMVAHGLVTHDGLQHYLSEGKALREIGDIPLELDPEDDDDLEF